MTVDYIEPFKFIALVIGRRCKMNEVLLCLVTLVPVMAAAWFPIGQRTMPIVNDFRHLLENFTINDKNIVKLKREGDTM